ncbi:DUF4855 domain-containing protein [Brevibacillus fluminis]|uniref:DUF4855 domain-containing protein n=1 Tax=Brevibacillus fluminis TaxID=511487 RepID=UPI003F895992
MPAGTLPGQTSGLLVYIGSGYETVTKDQITALSDMGVRDYVLVIGNQKFRYGDSAGQKQIINDCATAMDTFWKNWLASGTGRKVWVGVPLLDSTKTAYDNASAFIGVYKNYIDKMMEVAISNGANKSNFCGFYYTMEAVQPLDTVVDPSNPTATQTVKLMSDVSTYIRSLNKQFMWCPYYGFGANAKNIIKNLGIIANRTNIFDHILIQPAYYFHAGDNCDARTITAVKKSLSIRDDFNINGAVVDLDYKPVAGGRASNATAIIGAVMEMDSNVLNSKSSLYQQYEDAFIDLSNTHTSDFVFYANTTSLILSLSGMRDRIKKFYEYV